MTVTTEICNTFNKSASDYERFAKVQLEIGQRLFNRLDYLNIKPKRILDLGCGPGYFSKQLAAKYPKAQIVGLDLALDMLLQSKNKQGLFKKWSLINADMRHLPFESGTFDLVFANQVLHWANPMMPALREVNRVMAVNACLMFTTLGPSTFKEILSSWSGVNSHAHINDFPDMHDVGDWLMAEYFLNPVMDMESISLHYESLTQLIRALKSQGVKNINKNRNPGLTSKSSWKKFEENYEGFKTEKGKYPLSYEVVYGHAWKGERTRQDNGVESFIPISQITGLTKKK